MLIKSRFLNVCVLVYIVLSTYNPTLGIKRNGETAGGEFVDIIQKYSKCRGVELNMQVSDLGIDSMSYIAMLVELEEQYGIEFEDEMLVEDSFDKISDMHNFIYKKTKNMSKRGRKQICKIILKKQR